MSSIILGRLPSPFTLLAVTLLALLAQPSISVGLTPTLERAIHDREALDLSEFFAGSKPRPRLQVLEPANGALLERDSVSIRLSVKGFDLPSSLHDSKVCLGIASRGKRVVEECFDQSIEALHFHAANLSPGEPYMLRAVLFERSKALAVSVRSFRVAAIALPVIDGLALGSSQHSASSALPLTAAVSPPAATAHAVSPEAAGADAAAAEALRSARTLTIQTALQVAMAEQSAGAMTKAESIYREILDQHPKHADALHLLGVVHYQKGDPLAAIEFIEKAIRCSLSHDPTQAVITAAGAVGERGQGEGRASDLELTAGAALGGEAGNAARSDAANFHNSLGECMRAAGRPDEAAAHFRRALELRPGFVSAIFNLGLTSQQLSDWEGAVALFGEVVDAAFGVSSAAPPAPCAAPTAPFPCSPSRHLRRQRGGRGTLLTTACMISKSPRMR